MSVLKLSFILSCVLLGMIHSTTSAVFDLTDENFEQLTQASTGQTTGKWFVKFYAPWCGHCKKMAPLWEELADRVADAEFEQDGIVVAKLDGTKNKASISRFQIKGYPTLFFFADRQMFEYKGERSLQAFEDYVTGGYLKEDGKKVLPPPGMFDKLKGNSLDKFVNGLRSDLNHIFEVRKNAAGVLLAIGILLGFVLGYLFRGPKIPKKEKAE